MLRILIPGGSGQVGTILARRFHAQGHEVTVLSRYPQNMQWRTLPWDGESAGVWAHLLDSTDIVINLAGRSVHCRYTESNKAQILRSRLDSTRILGQAIASASNPPRLWLNASTATIYRHSIDQPQDDLTGEIGDPGSWGFSIEVATQWEQAFNAAHTPNTRKIALRSAMTMSPDPGGVFSVLSRLVKLGLGGTNGPGKQYVSWVHHRDFTRAIDFLIEHEELSGPINISSPNPLPNAEFMAALRTAWQQSIGLPATKWMLEIGAFLMRTETELILKSRRVVPTRLLNAGFEFLHADWPTAARQLVNDSR
ncbi:MAG: TIGR01777 family protein [Acidobacteria bacterium]|nr:TIGR01777 family protein [Acidobacteriota bacterium]